MATDSLASQGRSRAQVARGPGALRRFMLLRMASISYPGTEAEQLLLAPQDLRTADPSFATEIYNGHFGLAGSLVELASQSPFEIAPPSEGWARELYGFGWLRHLRVAGSELSREQAKALLGDFLRLHKTVRGLAWQPEVVGRRVISWLSNSVVVLDASNPKSYETFLRSLTAQLRYLSASYRDAPDGAPCLVALMALVYAGPCIAEQQAVVDRYLKPFCKELDRQIMSDGGHISRNPTTLVELLLDLLPLRQCFMARDRVPPKQLSDAIDRAMPMVSFFRLGDGTMVRFNGGGATATGRDRCRVRGAHGVDAGDLRVALDDRDDVGRHERGEAVEHAREPLLRVDDHSLHRQPREQESLCCEDDFRPRLLLFDVERTAGRRDPLPERRRPQDDDDTRSEIDARPRRKRARPRARHRDRLRGAASSGREDRRGRCCGEDGEEDGVVSATRTHRSRGTRGMRQRR